MTPVVYHSVLRTLLYLTAVQRGKFQLSRAIVIIYLERVLERECQRLTSIS